MPFSQCTTAGPYNAVPTNLLGVGSVCGLGLDLVGITLSSLRLATELPRQAARAFDVAPVLALCPTGKRTFLLPPCPVALRKRSIWYVVWTVMANLLRSHKIRSRRFATSLLCDQSHTQDFAGLISLRASKVLGPISRYRISDILPHMKLASRASRPGLNVGFLRVLCNGLCTAQRFHIEGEEQTCRVGCPDEPGSLSHYNECPLLYNMFISIWGQATVFPRRSHLPHDLITQVFLRSLQYGIVVMGFIDAFVYAHHQHRRSVENPGNFSDFIKGRIFFMTAITSAYARAYQATCLTRHIPAVLHRNFRLPTPKARYPHLPNVRATTRERGKDF